MRVLASALKDTLVVLSLDLNRIGDLGAESLTQLTRLQRLDLASCGVTAPGAAAIGKISTLRHLNIRSNDIEDEGCGHLAALPSLHSLDMLSNEETPAGLQSLTRLAPTLEKLIIDTRPGNDDMSASLAQLTNLTFLDWEAIDGVDLDEAASQGLSLTTTTALSSLTKLRHLSLSWHTALGDGLGALAGLAALTLLTHLNLQCVQLPPHGLRYVTRMPFLQELMIWVESWGAAYAPLTRLTSVTQLEVGTGYPGVGGAGYVAAMTNVRSLKLSGSDVRIADGIGSLTGLTHLDFSLMQNDEHVLDLPSQQLSRLNLESFNIRNAQIGAAAAAAAEVAKFTRLTHLDISSNNQGDEGAAWVAKLTNLTSLGIMDNAVSINGAVKLGQLSKLTHLNIGHNTVSPGAAMAVFHCSTKVGTNIHV